MVEVNFAGISDHSTVDYSKKNAAVIYLCGCPYKCPWCQNRELVLEEGCRKIDVEKIVDELKKNFLVDAVCITGGEPLMQEETIYLLKKIKEETNLLLKIDTNGYFPGRLSEALDYLDFISVDIKAQLNEKYGFATGLKENWISEVERLKESLEILGGWKGEKEARTTIVPGLADSDEDIDEISKIAGKFKFNIYTLQQFRNEKTLDLEYEKIKAPDYEKMLALGKTAKRNLPNIIVRIATEKKGFETI